MRVHRNCLVARDFIRGFERRVGDEGDAHWEVLLNDVPETLPVSRRQQSSSARSGREMRLTTSVKAAAPERMVSDRSSPRTLICGSLAYDTIMVFPDRFARHILPGPGAHAVGVVPDRRDAPRMGRLRRATSPTT